MKSELKQILQLLLLTRVEAPPSMLPAASTVDDFADDSSLSSSTSSSSTSSSSSRTIHQRNSNQSVVRRSVLLIGSVSFYLLATNGGIVDETSFHYWSSMSSSLRGGGYITLLPVMTSSSKTTTTMATTHDDMMMMMTKPSQHRGSRRSGRQRRQDRDGQRQPGRPKIMSPLLLGFMALQRSIDDIGAKIQLVVEDVMVKQWNELQDNIGREWVAMLSNIEKIFPQQQQQQQHFRTSLVSSSNKLDDVLHAFRSVLVKDGNNEVINTDQLLKACRAHLTLMKSGGPALRLVAKDMETNLLKAETLFRTISNEGTKNSSGKDLASLLQTEIDRGVHPDANILEESSAAMGLLWIRRSLAYQMELYRSLSSSSSSSSSSGSSIDAAGGHPRDAALRAYNKTLAPYHGWFLQKIFPLSLSQMPDRQVFLAKFGGREAHELFDKEYERIIEMKLQLLVRTWRPILDVWTKEFERLNLEDTRPA